MNAREEVLSRVRGAIAPLSSSPSPSTSEVPREYHRQSGDTVETFVERVEHYQAQAHRTALGGLDETVRGVLEQRGVRRIVVPDGVPEAWTEGLERLGDSPALSARMLDESDGVITTCAVAIAVSGTIVLDGSDGMGRRILSLVPDYHLCVVRAEQIVGSLPEAIAKLEPTRPLTFISGPSATVDIEMVRVNGVHGPRRLDVIIGG